MDNSEHALLCDKLHQYTSNRIASLNLGADEEANEYGVDMTDDKENAIRDLQTVTDFIMLYAELPKYRPYSLAATIQSLHDILILLVAEESTADVGAATVKKAPVAAIAALRASISRICEHWWTHKEAGAENFITQLVPHLLVTALKPGAHDSDVKRLHKVSGALLLLDFEDESIESIQSLLLRCAESALFLKSTEGRRFLAFLFSVHIGTCMPSPMYLNADYSQLMGIIFYFLIGLHGPLLEVFRSQLVDCAPRVATACGEVLYAAWKHAQIVQEREVGLPIITILPKTHLSLILFYPNPSFAVQSIEDCLQTLVHDAIHASDSRYFKSLRLALSVFHDAKRHHGVDTMLLRTYGPILWRSLRCANAFVRVQATMIFFDSFPLQDEEAAAAEADAILQKQFDLLTSMLKDCDHRVRAAAASGVCRVLREFWAALPPATTRQALSYVVGTLGRDAACANVRVAVMAGLCDLLEQPLAHGVLKSLLPILANSIHDTSERVRVAFIQILCRVKQIRGLTFYSIVTVENLLARLEDDRDRPAVCSQMTALLLNSFLPQLRADDCDDRGVALDPRMAQEKEAEQCRRCIEFLDKNPVTAVTFYAHIHEHAPLQTVARLLVNLFQLLVNTSSSVSAASAPKATNKGKGKANADKGGKPGKRDRGSTENEDGNVEAVAEDSPLLQSPAMYVNILKTLHAILTSISKKLDTPANLRIRETICHVLSRAQISALMSQAQSLLSAAAFLSDDVLESASQHLPEITCQYLKIVATVEAMRKGLEKNTRRPSLSTPQIDAGEYADDWNSTRFVKRFDGLLVEGGKAASSAAIVRAQARAVVETVLTFGDLVRICCFCCCSSYFGSSLFVNVFSSPFCLAVFSPGCWRWSSRLCRWRRRVAVRSGTEARRCAAAAAAVGVANARTTRSRPPMSPSCPRSARSSCCRRCTQSFLCARCISR